MRALPSYTTSTTPLYFFTAHLIFSQRTEPQQPAEIYCLKNYREFASLGRLWEATLRLGATFMTNSYFALIPSRDSFAQHWHGLTEPTAFLAPTLALN